MTSLPPKIEIIAVGTELLTPYYQDTDSLYITQRLNDLGLTVRFKTIVSDEAEDIQQCFRTALQRSDWIFMVGGLGPTEDDRTREVLAAALGRELVFRQDILDRIEGLFKKLGVSMSAANNKQAYIIQDAQVLVNKNGTAPGLWVDEGNKHIILLPGPPRELKPMFEASVWPRIQSFQPFFLVRRTLKLSGTGESYIESLISDLHPQALGLNLTMLSYPGQIEIHLTGRSENSEEEARARIQELETQLQKRLDEYIFSTSGEELEAVVGRLLKIRHKTLAVAESCTGGLLGHRITNAPGSSDYFLGGVQAYSNQVKIELLGVSEEQVQRHGAVSSEIARSMASGIRKKTRSDYALAITGVAGPDGGTPEKPVGLVFIALASEDGIVCKRNIFPGNRETIKLRSTQKALNMLRKHLLSHPSETQPRGKA